MINLSICPTAYCYRHDTDDKMKKKNFIPEILIQGGYGTPDLYSH